MVIFGRDRDYAAVFVCMRAFEAGVLGYDIVEGIADDKNRLIIEFIAIVARVVVLKFFEPVLGKLQTLIFDDPV